MKRLLFLLVVCGVFVFAGPTFAADATISGTITHAVDGTPIVSMYVMAQNISTGDYSYAYGTDAAGAYSITVSPGTYDVSPYTYTSTETGVTFIKKTTTMTVVSGETKSGQNFAMTRRGKFTGHVYTSDGVTPVSSAAVSATHANGYLAGSAYATTASNGSYTAVPNPNSDYTLSATGTYTFYVTRAGYYGATVTNVALSADETTVTQDIRLTPGSTVSGTVRDGSGTGISGATITLTKNLYGNVYTALSDSSGAYSVSIFDLTNYNGSAISDYSMTVSKTGYIAKTSTISVVSDGSTLTGNNVTLSPGGAITGTVKISDGSGLSGATVTADDGFGNIASATTDSSGVYTIASLRPSTRYILTATKTYYVGQKTYNVTVNADATTSGKNFTLPTAATFSGTVTVKGSGAVLEGATVYLYKRNRTRSEVADLSFTTKSDGTFLFRTASPGKYRVKVVKNGYITLVQDVLNLSSSIAGKSYQMELGGSILGRIFTGNNVGVPSADISVYALRNGKEVSYALLSSDENGYYSISGLKKGTYRLKVMTTDYIMKIADVAVKTGVQVSKSLKLAPAGSVTGFLTEKETGLPVSGAWIKVVGTPLYAVSDANGYYVIDGLTPGKRKLSVVSTFYDLPGKKNVTVVAGQTKAGFDFMLTPKQ